MTTESKTPARRAVRGGREIVQLGGTNNSENTFNPCNLQAFRVAYLARRHRLAPSIAAAVAAVVFEEARP